MGIPEEEKTSPGLSSGIRPQFQLWGHWSPGSHTKSEAQAPETAAKDSDLEEIVNLFSEEEPANEELHKLAMGLGEVDIRGLAEECLRVAAQLKRRRL